jgi:putative ABC transport system permease protein
MMLRRLRRLLRPRTLERDMDDEMRFHVEMEASDLVARGVAPEEARRRALVAFGGVERFKDEGRDARGVGPLEDFLRDVRFGARSLRRRPGFTTVVVLTLAVGIGGTTAIFGAVHGVLLAPFPYHEPDRIITVWTNDRIEGDDRQLVSPPNFLDWRERQRSFSTFATANPYSMDYLGPDGPEHLGTWLVTEGFFETFGIRPLLGRVFRPEEFTAGRNRVAVIGEDVWRSRFKADPQIIGRQLTLDSVPRTIIGVMPRSFRFAAERQVWQPYVFDDVDRQRRRSTYLTVVGRLRPGVTLAAGRADLATISAQLEREYPRSNTGVSATLVPLPEQTVGHVRKALLVLLGAVGLVLLIACGNVAGLLLARAVQREREVAVRVALGAGRGRILRQLGAESLVLAVAGGVAGLAVAFGGIAAIRALGPETLPRLDEIAIGPSVLAFALAATLGAAILFGIAPAVHATPSDVRERLAAGSARSGSSRPRRRLQSAFVVVQFALALVLLVGAGLLVRSFVSLLRVERGFDPRGVLTATIQSWAYYPTPDRRAAFVQEATARLAALPGVQAAGMTSDVPLAETIGQNEAAIEIEGRPPATLEESRTVRVAAVTSGYFSALRIPLRAGRTFASTDVRGGPLVALVSEALVRRHFPNQSPLGQRIKVTFAGPVVPRTIVGVVADVRRGGLHEAPQPTVYLPHSQAATGANAFVVRTSGDPLAVLGQLRAEFRTINPVMPIASTATLESLLDDSLRERRFHLALLGAFASVALLLAALGVYGVMSHATTERTHEIGVRMALGARGRDVLGMVMRQGAALAVAGAIGGLIGAAAVTRLLRGMLYGVTPLDPLAYVAAGALLLAAAALACYLPARRAARLDPVRALRVE